jgi:twinkle protein
MMKATATRIGEAKCRIVKAPKEVKDKIRDFYAGYGLTIDKVDANNVLVICGDAVLRKMVDESEMPPNKSLKFLMSVEEIDIRDIEKMSTGYKNLDNLIYGSLMGCFTILSGPTGAGKSTIANQLCVLSPLEQGYKTFLYSGELSEGQLKNWIVKPLAGVDHVLRWKNPNSPAGYTPTHEASREISQYYMKDIILHSDDDALAASDDEILKQMEDSFRRYGCKVFLIDNLMTVGFNDDSDDTWKAQKEFIKKLLRFTNKYNVNVTLVAHPKKPSKGEEPGVYSIHGASELVNLCHRLLWVDLLQNDPEGYNSQIRIIKDRVSGRANKSCKLRYDPRTMRLYSDVGEQYHIYAWARKTKIKYSEGINAQLAVNFQDDTDDVLGAQPN